MEWSGWFNELWMQLNVPSIKKGRIYGRTKFDGLYNDFDIDFKAHDIEKDTVICNDKNAMYESICQHGKIYLIVSIFKYDKDKDGEFKKWHDELKGKKSSYVKKCEKLNKKSRIRKTKEYLQKINIYELNENNLNICNGFQKGFENSGGSKRKEKLTLNLTKIEPIIEIIT